MIGSRNEEQIQCIQCGKYIVKSQVENHLKLSFKCSLLSQIDLAAEEIKYDILGR